MKALSLLQPWASAIVEGRKRYETRGYATSYRGLLAIHASSALPAFARQTAAELGIDVDPLPRGAVIGVVRLIACYRTETVATMSERLIVVPREGRLLQVPPLTARERRLGDWAPGRWAWLVEVAERFAEPIPARGSLGLWSWERPA